MAFKVINAAGEFRGSDIIAAIERAVDPNQDGDFSDMVDVVNIGLGSSPGSPDDARSTAVDNAVALGVVFCISAGNRGNGGEFYTIGSPGMARSAITVGASRKDDTIATFSSRGPNIKIFSIKPEVVAPGVNIVSSYPNGQYAALSGTSMSAPHVAGVAALLRALHPGWTPAQIKSALMTTAIDLNQEVMVQGAGRIDAFKAAQVQTFAIPSHASFGFVDDSQAQWDESLTISIMNEASGPQSFQIGFDGIRSGIQLAAQPPDFSINPGESQDVIVSLSVNTNTIANRPLGTSQSYGGTVAFLGTTDTLRIPWAFVKALKLRLTFDERMLSFW